MCEKNSTIKLLKLGALCFEMIPAVHFGWQFCPVHQRTPLGQTSSSKPMQKVCHWRMTSSRRAAREDEESLILHNI